MPTLNSTTARKLLSTKPRLKRIGLPASALGDQTLAGAPDSLERLYPSAPDPGNDDAAASQALVERLKTCSLGSVKRIILIEDGDWSGARDGIKRVCATRRIKVSGKYGDDL